MWWAKTDMSRARFPRRSLLYTPGDQIELLEKAFNTEADTLIFDFEDSVNPANKPLARDNVVSLSDDIAATDKEVSVRINAIKTEYWLDDLRAAIEAGVDTVKIPMVESTWELRTIREAERAIDPTASLEYALGLETPEGILAGSEIATFTRDKPAFSNVNFGMADYTNAIGAPKPSPAIGDMLRFLTVSYASMGRMDPIGSALLDIQDHEGQRETAERNREFGYIGMTGIHPDQMPIINEVFTPTSDEVEEAKQMVETFEATDQDSIMVDGVFLDAPVVKRYRKVLDRAELVGMVRK